MGKPGAFLDIDRVTHELRPVEERSRDFDPLYVELDDDAAFLRSHFLPCRIKCVHNDAAPSEPEALAPLPPLWNYI